VLKKYAWGPILEWLVKREKSIETPSRRPSGRAEECSANNGRHERPAGRGQPADPRIADGRGPAAPADPAPEEMRTQAAAESRKSASLRPRIGSRRPGLQDIWNQAANLATLISAQVIRRARWSGEDHRRLVHEALEEVEALPPRARAGPPRPARMGPPAGGAKI